jgi:hypothetical protein
MAAPLVQQESSGEAAAAASPSQPTITISDIIAASDGFMPGSHFRWPSAHNRIQHYIAARSFTPEDRTKIEQEIMQMARSVRILAHSRTSSFIESFLSFKRAHGSAPERALYASMEPAAFLERCIHKRPVVFFLSCDSALLRDGTKLSGGFESIGTSSEKSPLILQDYLSYDEIAISALLSVSLPTYFINQGSRGNRARPSSDPHSFVPRGIITGAVGARFERDGYMEWAHCVVHPQQNTKERGYGPQDGERMSEAAALLKLWANFYGLDHFPTFTEVSNLLEGKAAQPQQPKAEEDEFIKLWNGSFFNVRVYLQRMRMTIIPFLLDADARAKEAGTKAYVRTVGLGLGVWALSGMPSSDLQDRIMIDLYHSILSEVKLPHVSDLEFLWFEASAGEESKFHGDKGFKHGNGNEIKVSFTKGNPAAPMNTEDKAKLLVTCYAWDGNSYPGNEYWFGALTASGDPAAACCSAIPELQNPQINPWLNRNCITVLGQADGKQAESEQNAKL